MIGGTPKFHGISPQNIVFYGTVASWKRVNYHSANWNYYLIIPNLQLANLQILRIGKSNTNMIQIPQQTFSLPEGNHSEPRETCGKKSRWTKTNNMISSGLIMDLRQNTLRFQKNIRESMQTNTGIHQGPKAEKNLSWKSGIFMDFLGKSGYFTNLNSSAIWG